MNCLTGAHVGFHMSCGVDAGRSRSFSTSASSRLSRVADREDEQQFTTTFSLQVPHIAATIAPTQLPAVTSQNDATGSAATAVTPAAAALPETKATPTASTTKTTTSDTGILDIYSLLSGETRAAAATESSSAPAVELLLPRSPIPLELLPPRRTNVHRVSLLSPSHTDPIDDGDDDEVQGDVSVFSPPSTPTVERYTQLFYHSFVNPFNGRLIRGDSPLAKLLYKIGFYRSHTNPLHIEWSPTEYITALQNIIADDQRRRESRKRKQQRQQRREERLARAAAHEQGQGKGKRMRDRRSAPRIAAARSADAGRDAAAGVPAVTPSSVALSLEPPTAAEAVAQARAKLLRPLRRSSTDSWMATVADIVERQDVFTFMNKEVDRLYRALCTAYIPPKLDTPVDPSIVDVELTLDQQRVLQLARNGYNIFVGGSAGTGKTVLLKFIFRDLSLLGLRVAVTATTGVAGVQLGGCTFHHAFNVPVDAMPQRWDANALRAVDVVIVDEVSLLDANMFDAFDMEARLARMQHTPFGGLQVIVCGDFLQLSREDAMPAYESAAFKYLVATRLVTPMRHCAGDPLLRLLEQLRRGEFDTAQFAALDRPVPPSTTHITYIFPRRREAQKLNDEKLGELESQEMTFTPQRGPLQLCGAFTPSALLEVARDENGMQRPLPRREQLLEMIEEEARRGNSGKGTAFQIADHELVVMPVRADGTTTATRFAVRVRCRDVKEVSASASASSPAPGAESGTAAVATPVANTAMGVAARHTAPPGGSKGSRSVAPFSDAEWQRIAAAVAGRLGGRLVSMHAVEPASWVPLSVSMTLADMTSPDIAHSLSPLRLKLGCRVMVNRNLSRTVSNGSVGTVEAFAPPDPNLFPRSASRGRRIAFAHRTHSKLFEELPVVRLLSGEVVQVPPVSILVGGTAQSYYYGHEVFTIPLQLGYAFTVHKVQGLTLQGTVVLDCRCFFECPHLIYVACSRVRRLDQLVVRHVEPKMIIVRRSALEFSNRLLEACAVNLHTLPATCARGSWVKRTSQRVVTVAD